MGYRALWAKWILRDLRSRWIQVILISFVIAIGTGTYSGLSSTTSWRLKSNDASFSATNMHDFKVYSQSGNLFQEGEIGEILAPLVNKGVITGVEDRLTLPTQIKAEGVNGSVIAPGLLVGIDESRGVSQIDKLHFTGGDWGNYDTGSTIDYAVLDHTFAENNGIPNSSIIELPGGKKIEVSGTGLTPQHFIPINDSGLGFGGVFAIVYMPLNKVQFLQNQEGKTSESLITISNPENRKNLKTELTLILQQSFPNYGIGIEEKKEDRVYKLLYEGAGADQKFYHVIGIAILLGAVFAAFNLTVRVVQSQRREIGIGMAMGASLLSLAARPIILGLNISIFGTIFGILVGKLINGTMRTVLMQELPLPIWLTPFEPKYFLWVGIGGFLAPIIATLVPVIYGLNIQPIDAIRTGHLAPVRKGLSPLLSRLPFPGNTFWQIPFRNLLRTPRRTFLTLLGIAGVIGVMTSVLGMVDSFSLTLDKATSESSIKGSQRIEVIFDKFQAVDSPIFTYLKDSEAVTEIQPVIQFAGTASNIEHKKSGDEISILTTVIDFQNTMWRPTLVSGKYPKEHNEILISSAAAKSLGATSGDQVLVNHPIVTVQGTPSFLKSQFTISGIHPHPFRAYSYVASSQAKESGMDGLAGGVWIKTDQSADWDKIQTDLYTIAGVSSVQESGINDRAMKEELKGQMNILKIVQFVVLFLALLIAFNTASINMDDRAREHATFMAFGLPVSKIMLMSIIESATLGLLASIAGLGIGFLLLDYFINTVFASALPEIGMYLSVSTTTYVNTIVLGVFAVGIAPVFAIRKLTRTNIPSTLRVLE